MLSGFDRRECSDCLEESELLNAAYNTRLLRRSKAKVCKAYHGASEKAWNSGKVNSARGTCVGHFNSNSMLSSYRSPRTLVGNLAREADLWRKVRDEASFRHSEKLVWCIPILVYTVVTKRMQLRACVLYCCCILLMKSHHFPNNNTTQTVFEGPTTGQSWLVDLP